MTRVVVSAEDVRAARRAGDTRLTVPADALVTPLARDEAARWGIQLVDRARGDPAARAHRATCDDPGDPLERIVALVRQRVPEADPEQVREIARRVLERVGR